MKATENLRNTQKHTLKYKVIMYSMQRWQSNGGRQEKKRRKKHNITVPKEPQKP